MMRPWIPIAVLLLSACRASEAPDNRAATPAPTTDAQAPAPSQSPAPAPPAAPQAPPPAEDRTPVSEAPFSDTSAQGAANVVQTYFALVEEKNYAAAWKLWPDGPRERFAARFAPYRDYHAEVFAPGDTEGAAGSIYVDVPARIYGTLTSGIAFSKKVTVTLRRVDDVDGSTAEQRRWHIARIADAATA